MIQRQYLALLGATILLLALLGQIFVSKNGLYELRNLWYTGNKDANLDIPLETMVLTTIRHKEESKDDERYGMIEGIPRVIYQTISDKHTIPDKVTKNLQQYSNGFKRYVFDDKECISFLQNHFHSNIVTTFHLLSGAHRADLVRYGILYVHGGIYLDIKTELVTPLENIFLREKLTIDPPLEKLFPYSNTSSRPSRRYRDNELLSSKPRPLSTVVSMKNSPMQNHSHSNGHNHNRNNNSISRHNLHNHTHAHAPRMSESSEKNGYIPSRPVLYTVLSKGIGSRSIYQGIIATPPHNPLFLRLIQDFLVMKKPVSEERYHVSTESFYEEIVKDTHTFELSTGLNGRIVFNSPDQNNNVTDQLFNYGLFIEKGVNVSLCHDGPDRYSGCHMVFRNQGQGLPQDIVFKTRYADYPWKKPSTGSTFKKVMRFFGMQ